MADETTNAEELQSEVANKWAEKRDALLAEKAPAVEETPTEVVPEEEEVNTPQVKEMAEKELSKLSENQLKQWSDKLTNLYKTETKTAGLTDEEAQAIIDEAKSNSKSTYVNLATQGKQMLDKLQQQQDAFNKRFEWQKAMNKAWSDKQAEQVSQKVRKDMQKQAQADAIKAQADSFAKAQKQVSDNIKTAIKGNNPLTADFAITPQRVTTAQTERQMQDNVDSISKELDKPLEQEFTKAKEQITKDNAKLRANQGAFMPQMATGMLEGINEAKNLDIEKIAKASAGAITNGKNYTKEQKQQIYQIALSKAYDKLKGNTKGNTEHIVRKTFLDNSVANLMKAGVAKSTGNYYLNQASQERDAEYGAKHTFANVAGAVGSFVTDLGAMGASSLGGAVGSRVGGAIAGTLARNLAMRSGGKVALNTAMRMVANKAIVPIAGAMAGGATNLGMWEGMSDATNQLATSKDYSLLQTLGAMGRGAILGVVTGGTGHLIGNITNKAVSAVSSTGAKVGTKVGGGLASWGAETTIFATPEMIADPEHAGDIWLDNGAMMAGFKVHGGVKSAGKFIDGVKKFKGDNLSASQLAYNNKSIFQRVKEQFNAHPYECKFTPDEEAEISNGYGELLNLDSSMSVEEYKSLLGKFMNDKNVSASAKARMAFILTGKRMAMPTILTTEIKEQDGKHVVTAYGLNDTIVMRKSFSDAKQAQKCLVETGEQAQINNVEILESDAKAKGGDVNAIRESVKEDTGKDIGKVLAKSFEQRTDEEHDAYADYMDKLAQVKPKEEKLELEPEKPAEDGKIPAEKERIEPDPKEGGTPTEAEEKPAEEEKRQSEDVEPISKEDDATYEREDDEQKVTEEPTEEDSSVTENTPSEEGKRTDETAIEEGAKESEPAESDSKVRQKDELSGELSDEQGNPIEEEPKVSETAETAQGKGEENLLTSGSYFSGGGLLEEGLKGIIKPSIAVEFDKKISGVYADNFGHHIVVADVRDVDPNDLAKHIDGEVSYFHASPVCKNFSQMKTTNGGEASIDKETAQATANFINQVKPKVVTIENVPQYQKSESLSIITKALEENGYKYDVGVYDNADFGGYTRRKRLIVRAVRDGELPPKPKALDAESRPRGWGEAVADLLPTLPESKLGVPPFIDKRLKAEGIDYRHIDKPLYVFGFGYNANSIGHAFIDEIMPTFLTRGGDRIIMPDGRVLKPTPRVLARITGLSDDYKMPESDTMAHLIIGNGIPTHLTRGVIAPLLKSVFGDGGKELMTSTDGENGSIADEPKPIGKGAFGNVYDAFKGKVKEAIQFLSQKKEGEAVGALHHKDIGEISLVWGNAKAGLEKIMWKHPEVIDNLQEIIDGMHIVQSSDNRIILESNTHKAVVSKEFKGDSRGNWLLTAYEKKDASGGSIDIVPEPNKGKQNGTAPLQDISSADKVSETAETAQGKGEENAEHLSEVATETAEALGMKVRFAYSDELQGRDAISKGWHNEGTDEMVIVLDNNADADDIRATVYHEGVAHYGLRKMFGSEFDNFIQNVYDHAGTEIRNAIAEIGVRKGYEPMEATEEYLAKLAEDGKFKELNPSSWEKIKYFFKGMLSRFGLREISDDELRYSLWRSYQLRINGSKPTLMERAMDIAMQHRFKLGNYAPRSHRHYRTIGGGQIPKRKIAKEYDEQIGKSGYQAKEAFLDETASLDWYLRKASMRKYMEDVPGYINPYLGANRVGQVTKEDIEFFKRDFADPIHKEVGKLMDEMSGKREERYQKITEYLMAKHGLERNNVMRQRATEERAREIYERAVDQLPALDGKLKATAYDLQQNPNDPSCKTAYDNALLARDEAQQIIDDAQSDWDAFVASHDVAAAKARQRLQNLQTAQINAMADVQQAQVRSQKSPNNKTYLKAYDRAVARLKAIQDEIAYATNEWDLFVLQYSDDYAGLTGLTKGEAEQSVPLDEATRRARQIVESFENNHKTDELWKRINKATHEILRKQYEGGMISEDKMNEIADTYQYYVPLRGFSDTTADDEYAYLQHGEGRQNVLKKAEGRSSMADDPLAYIEQMANDGIIRANDNALVKRTFLDFVQSHPTDLISATPIYIHRNPVSGKWEIADLPQIDPNDSAEVIEEKMRKYVEQMENLIQTDSRNYRKVSEKVIIPYIIDKNKLKEHQIIAYRDGVPTLMTVNGNPRLAQAINNVRARTEGAVDSIVHTMKNLTRKVSMMYTGMNLDFIPSNFTRDSIFANTIVWIKESPKYALQFNKNYLALGMKDGVFATAQLFRKYRNGTLDMNNYIEKMFYEFMRNGAEVSYAEMASIEKTKKQVMRSIEGKKTLGETITKNAVAQTISDVARGVENRARFAAYLTSREAGRDIARSVWDAREISVNFITRGARDKYFRKTGQTFVGNASGILSEVGNIGYAFFNASLQGSANFARAINRNRAKGLAMCSGLFALGLATAWLGKQQDDDDSDNRYFDQPKHLRRQNMIVKSGKNWITIPLNTEYRAFFGFGEMVGSQLFNGEEVSASDVAMQFTQLAPVDVLEGGKAFIPTVFKPLAEANSNESWYGSPIWKETPYNELAPQYTKAYSSTPKYMVEWAEKLNALSGGNKYRKGTLDWNPATIDYLLKQYGGSFYALPRQAYGLMKDAKGDKDFNWRDVPMANRFIKTGGDERRTNASLNEKFEDIRQKYEMVWYDFNNTRRDRLMDTDERLQHLHDMMQDEGDWLRLKGLMKGYDKLMARRSQMSKAGNQEAVKAINERIQELKQIIVERAEETEAEK